MATKNYRLFDNSRFYVLITTILLSVIVAAWLRIVVESDQLYYIRLQQTYGLLCVLYWYLALIISPLGYVIGKARLKHLEFSRRAIGVSAAYFATLHVAVALWGQLGGPAALTYLPDAFKWSLIAGSIAFVILLAMAATSFDRVITFMSFRRWKWLHRLVYAGGVLAIIHIWSVGTHVTYSGVQLAAFIALIVLSGLETYRGVTLLGRRYPTTFGDINYRVALFVGLWSVWIVLIASIPTLVDSYHGDHQVSDISRPAEGRVG